MERSKILTDDARELLSKYPLYTQDGKGGEAVAVLRLFLTGTAAVFYITEGQPCGEYENRENWELFGVSNLERGEGWRYDYFSLAELEGLNLYHGLVHLERDTKFTPRPLRDIPELVADLSELWKADREAADDDGDEPDAQGDGNDG